MDTASPCRRRRLSGAAVRSVLITALLSSAAVARAQDGDPARLTSMGLEELMDVEVKTVYGASKYEQRIAEAPSSVTIVTAEDIRKYGYRTLGDILRSVRSFYVTYDRNYDYIGVRGFGRPGDYNTRVLLTIDGHRMNDAVYDSVLAGTEEVLDVDLIDRIEIIRGPGSSLYGSNAFFAVVSIITRKGHQVSPAEIAAAASRYGTYEGRISVGTGRSSGVEALVSASALRSDGQQLYFPEYAATTPTGGVTDGTDDDRRRQGFASLSSDGFTVSGAYSRRTKGIPTGAYGTDFNDPATEATDTRAYVDLRYERRLGSSAELTARTSFDRYAYRAAWAYYQAYGSLNRDEVDGDWWGAELRLTMRPHPAHTLVIGADYQGNARQHQRNYDEDPFFLYLEDERRSSVRAAYLQEEWKVSQRMLLNAGVRYDWYETFGDAINPRFGAIASLTERDTVKLLYGTAFRAPNAYELYYEAPTSTGTVLRNPDLRPEKISTSEIVYERTTEHGLRASIAGYVYRIRNLIDQTVIGGIDLQFQNLSTVEARGLEFELMKRWEAGSEASASYTVQRAEDLSTGKVLTNSPEQMAKFRVALPLVRRSVMFAWEEQYIGSRLTMAGARIGDAALANATLLIRNLAPSLEISLGVTNLFDRVYRDPVALAPAPLDSVEQNGRNARVKLTYFF